MQNASMTDAASEKRLSRLLSHSAHEVRNSLSVALGYTGFVLRDRKVQVSDQHRQWLEVAQKACGKLAELANEMSDLAKLESGDAGLVRTATDLRALLAGAIAALPVAEREHNIDIELSTGDGLAMVDADTSRLRKAFGAVLVALRQAALPGVKLRVEERSRDHAGRRISWIVIGDAEQVEALRYATADALVTFNPSVGNTGISLWTAQWVLNAHGGLIWSPGDKTKSAAVIMLPLRS
jgi:signal transduction histidine kinase